jgi:hypothetical protein
VVSEVGGKHAVSCILQRNSDEQHRLDKHSITSDQTRRMSGWESRFKRVLWCIPCAILVFTSQLIAV